jgi:hypothetical protein
VAGSLREPYPVYGPPFGVAVWASSYVILPEAMNYKPIWEYDVKTLARDLGGHLAYGAGTGTVFCYWSEAAKERTDPASIFYYWKGERPRHPNAPSSREPARSG